MAHGVTSVGGPRVYAVGCLSVSAPCCSALFDPVLALFGRKARSTKQCTEWYSVGVYGSVRCRCTVSVGVRCTPASVSVWLVIILLVFVASGPVGVSWPCTAHPRPLAEGITVHYAMKQPLPDWLRRWAMDGSMAHLLVHATRLRLSLGSQRLGYACLI